MYLPNLSVETLYFSPFTVNVISVFLTMPLSLLTVPVILILSLAFVLYFIAFCPSTAFPSKSNIVEFGTTLP